MKFAGKMDNCSTKTCSMHKAPILVMVEEMLIAECYDPQTPLYIMNTLLYLN
jgi:hypothetical protein